MNKSNPLKLIVSLLLLVMTGVFANCANPTENNLVSCTESGEQCGYNEQCCEGLRCTFNLPAGISTCQSS